MISSFFSSAGRMVRAAIILGAVMSAVALMVMGAKVSGWFTDAQQVARARDLDEREAALKAADRAAQDKREAELSRREAALFALAPKEAAKVADAREELARVKAETAKAQEAANKASKRAEEAERRVAAAVVVPVAEPAPSKLPPWLEYSKFEAMSIEGRDIKLINNLYATKEIMCTSGRKVAVMDYTKAPSFACWRLVGNTIYFTSITDGASLASYPVNTYLAARASTLI
jgi:hypothetical protein